MTDTQITDVTGTPEYERLRADFIRMEAERSHWKNVARNYEKAHIDDIHKIGTALIAEAETRDWCDLYDEFISELNEKLNRPLDVRQHEYDIEVEYTVKVHRNVTAATWDDALESLRQDVEGEMDDMEDVEYEFVRGTDFT